MNTGSCMHQYLYIFLITLCNDNNCVCMTNFKGCGSENEKKTSL